jgi:HlyD family secretion protein
MRLGIKWAIGAALALGLAACHAPPAPSLRAEARTVTVTRVALRSIAGGIVTSGVLVPRNQVEINPDLSGYRVSKLYVDEGDWVKAGQPLVEMDPSILQAQYDQQVALANQQKATATQRVAESARVTGLDTQGVMSTEDVQARGYTADTAKAGAAAQVAAANEIETRLQHLVVRAPVSGLIIQRSVNLGDISGGGATAWFVMAQDGQIELNADVAEADFDKITPGVRAKVTLADNASADGVVRLISPRVDATTQLGKVRITLPVRPDIRSGGYAKATFTNLSRQTDTVPEAAVRYDAGGASVMVVGDDDHISQIPVITGERGGGYVELLKGPPPGTVVVAKAAAQLLPGDYVKPDWSGDSP